MKVLMSGSHGFVGTNLIEALTREHEIIRWDAREDRVLPECDAVIHLAGLAHDVKKSQGRWKKEDYFQVNTELTKRIYDRFLESGAKKFIFFSSIKALDVDTAYAKSKKLAEVYIESKKEEVRGKKYYVLRPCMIHGKGNKGNLNLLVKWVKRGWPWPLAAFENKRNFASIGNVVFIVSELLNKDVESGIYNICDDEAVSTNELIEMICQCMGKKAKLWRVPRPIMYLFAKLGDVLHLALNSERIEKLTKNYIVDNSKIKHALDMERMPVGAREGLLQTIYCMIDDKGK